jgi:acyl-CoA reductase-like NAD-dependent aldehyde dehydrogenase
VQVCSNGTRVFVHRSIFREFVDRLVGKTAALKVGDPMAEDTMVGATISEQQAQKVLAYIDHARQQVRQAGAKLHYLFHEINGLRIMG